MIGKSICKCIENNSILEKLNIESNFISAKQMTDVVHQCCQSPSLIELRIDNQRNKFVNLESRTARHLSRTFRHV